MTYNGQLNKNEIFGVLFNMILSQEVFGDNISGLDNSLVEKFKVDGGLNGDTKLYLATDCLSSSEWNGDNEAVNLLKIDRPEEPKEQSIVVDKARIIPVTIDRVLTKRAFSDENVFNQFASIILNWIGETKKIYDTTLINSYVGTTKSKATKGTVEIDLTTPVGTIKGEEKSRIRGQSIAKGIADLMFDLKDISRDYTDNGFTRAYNKSDLLVIWNNSYVNEITYMDLPTIFHKENLVSFENVLPSRYFGDVGTTDVVSDGTYRSFVEAYYATGVNQPVKHLFAGDLIPSGYYKATAVKETKTGTSKYRVSDTKIATSVESKLLAGEYYKENAKVICKVIHKNAIPFMSSFQTNSTFFNQRSQTENHYLIWGYSTPQYLEDKPFITVVEK